METTNHWIHYQDFPPDVVVEVGETSFALHKFVLVSKSNHIRKLVMDSKEKDLNRIDLSDIPGGAEIFEKVAKFCYGVNFEITLDNVAALCCAAKYLQMTDNYCENNLVGRTVDFLTEVAFSGFSGSITVLRSCQDLLPIAQELKIVDQCIQVASFMAHREENSPTRSPPYWWAEELAILDVKFFGKIINSMKQRGATAKTLAAAIMRYTEKTVNINRSDTTNKRDIVESIVAFLPSDMTVFPVNFLCRLLQSAIFVNALRNCVKELERRISVLMEHVTVDDLLLLSCSQDGERLLDLESVRKIISAYVEKEKSVAVFSSSDFTEIYSVALRKVAKTVDVYLSEIAIYDELSISKFNAIAALVPKGARNLDDDLYRAIDIYLKAHPNLDEVRREKVCTMMDPMSLKLSHEARTHASQNNRLPAKVVRHALYYYDQPNNIIGSNENTGTTRSQVLADVSLVKENDDLRSELMMMKAFVSQMQPKNNKHQDAKVGPKRPTLFSSMSKQLGKLNPFRNVSKDTSNIVDEPVVDVKKPRRRRFSIS